MGKSPGRCNPGNSHHRESSFLPPFVFCQALLGPVAGEGLAYKVIFMIDLRHGDCLQLMEDIPDKSVDMILCDPPYGITSRNTWDKVISPPLMMEQYKRIIKPNGAILLFSMLPFSCDLIQANRKCFRYEWVWQKTKAVGFLNANRMPLRGHENILVFYNKLPTYNPQKTRYGKPYKAVSGNKGSKNYGKFRTGFKTGCDDGARFPVDVIKFPKNHAKDGHPTQKPTALLEYLIRTYTNEGETVLDNCMGSGSTGVACINTGRNFIGMEVDDHYFQVAKNRIEAAQREHEGAECYAKLQTADV